MKPIQLAKEVNLPQPTVHRLVTGKSTRPYKSSIAPIAEYFGVTTNQLLGIEPLPNTETKKSSINKIHNKHIKTIPLTSWQNLEPNKEHIAEDEIVIVGNVSDKAFALSMPDYSMEPLFQKGSTLIFDPEVTAVDRNFALIKLTDSNSYVFRQLLIDLDHKYIKSLDPNISASSMRLLKDDDEIIACLIEARNNFQQKN